MIRKIAIKFVKSRMAKKKKQVDELRAIMNSGERFPESLFGIHNQKLQDYYFYESVLECLVETRGGN